ncbi:hypothetical protein ACF07V_06665 [Streptomyces sp. NPDC015661]|uniref:hypothetical protein n=1 Tax=Streptomyces sp. NPDC015661 TaxID=3364961 RepID=UPI0036FC3A14
MPGPLGAAPDENEDEDTDGMERLRRITGWTHSDQRPDMDWAETESGLGTELPSDYKRMVETSGKGALDGFLDLNQEPWTSLKGDGLLIWAGTEHENLSCWRADGDDPDRWPMAVRVFEGEDITFDCRAAPSSSAASSSTRTTRSRWAAFSTPTGS